MLDFNINEESFNTLDEKLQGFYQKKDDGNYQLTINGLPSVDGLKSKNTELLGEMKKERELRTQLEEQLANFEAQKQQEIEKAHKKNGDVEALEKSYLEKIAKLEKLSGEKEQALQKQIYDLTVGQTATTIAAELALKGSASVLLPHIQNRLTLDENQKVRVLDLQGNISVLTLDDLKQEFRANDAFKPLIAGTYGQGSGAVGSSNKPSSMKRSEMSAEQMSAYIKEHGVQNYLKLAK